MPCKNIKKNLSFSDLYLKNKERITFRSNKLIIKLRGYFIDLKCIFFVPQLNRFLNSILNKENNNNLTIGIFRQGGFGDRMVLGAFATAVKRKFPNSQITAIVNISKDTLVRNQAIDKIKLINHVKWNKVVKYNKRRYDVFYELRFVPRVFVNNVSLNKYKRDVDSTSIKYLEEYNKCLIHNIPDNLGRLNKNSIDFLCECALLNGGEEDLSINLSENDKKIVDSIPFSSYITMSNGAFMGGRGTKCWPTDSWIELVKKIKDIGLQSVQLGIEKDEYLEGSYDLRGKTTIYEAAAIIKHSFIHIDTEGGLVYIAKAVGQRSIVLFGPNYPGFLGLKGNINLRGGDDICEPCCYKNGWWWKCHLGYNSCKAMKAIKQEDVFQEVLKLNAINSNIN